MEKYGDICNPCHSVLRPAYFVKVESSANSLKKHFDLQTSAKRDMIAVSSYRCIVSCIDIPCKRFLIAEVPKVIWKWLKWH